jgi:hypothetical protein
MLRLIQRRPGLLGGLKGESYIDIGVLNGMTAKNAAWRQLQADAA